MRRTISVNGNKINQAFRALAKKIAEFHVKPAAAQGEEEARTPLPTIRRGAIHRREIVEACHDAVVTGAETAGPDGLWNRSTIDDVV